MVAAAALRTSLLFALLLLAGLLLGLLVALLLLAHLLLALLLLAGLLLGLLVALLLLAHLLFALLLLAGLLLGLLVALLLLAHLLFALLLLAILLARLLLALLLRRRRLPASVLAAVWTAALTVRPVAGPRASVRAPRVGRVVDVGLGRAAAVAFVGLVAVAAGVAHVAVLHLGGRRVAFLARGQFAGIGAALDARRSAVVADAALVHVLDHHVVLIDVGHARDVDVGDRAVVVEAVALPVAAHIAHAGVAEAVVDAAIEAHVRPPVAGGPDVHAIGEAPVARRPQRAHVGASTQAPGTQKKP